MTGFKADPLDAVDDGGAFLVSGVFGFIAHSEQTDAFFKGGAPSGVATSGPVSPVPLRPLFWRCGKESTLFFNIFSAHLSTVFSPNLVGKVSPTGVSGFNRFLTPLMSPDPKPPVTFMPAPAVHRRRANKKIGRIVRAALADGHPMVHLHPGHLLGAEPPVFLGDDPMWPSFKFDNGNAVFHGAVCFWEVLPFAQGEFLLCKVLFHQRRRSRPMKKPP